MSITIESLTQEQKDAIITSAISLFNALLSPNESPSENSTSATVTTSDVVPEAPEADESVTVPEQTIGTDTVTPSELPDGPPSTGGTTGE